MKKCLFFLLAALVGGTLSALDGVMDFDGTTRCITAIQDAENTFPASLFFDPAHPEAKPDRKTYPASVNVFLVRDKKSGELFMIDAGYAMRPLGQGTLLEKLTAAGIDPAAVKHIFITHIHPDHVGGLIRNADTRLADGTIFSHRLTPAFPQAVLHVAKTEYDACKNDPKRADLIAFLRWYPLDLFEYGKPLPGGFIPRLQTGHTPGHTVYQLPEIQKDNKIIDPRVLFVGDILHAVDLQVRQFQFCAKYDMDPGRAVASRDDVLLTGGGTLFGAHFPFPGGIDIIKEIRADGFDTFSFMPAKATPYQPVPKVENHRQK